MTEVKQDNKAHTLTVQARTHAGIAGVVEVLSFDEESVVLNTLCGEMTVEGEGLHVGTLDMTKGVLDVDGQISAIYYREAAPQRRRGRKFFA